jgi:hypothetical protein
MQGGAAVVRGASMDVWLRKWRGRRVNRAAGLSAHFNDREESEAMEGDSLGAAGWYRVITVSAHSHGCTRPQQQTSSSSGTIVTPHSAPRRPCI